MYCPKPIIVTFSTFFILIALLSSLRAQDLDTMSMWDLQEHANNYIEAYQYEKALPYYRAITKEHKANRGKLDSLFIDSKITQSMLAYHTSNYDEAIACFKELSEIYLEQNGEQDANYLMQLSNLGAAHEYKAEFKKSEEYYKKNLAIRKKYALKNNAGLASVLNNLAVLYYNLGRYEEALPLYKQVLKLDEETVGEQHINYAITLTNIASLYGELGQHEKNLIAIEKSIRIRKKVVGDMHPSLANAYNNLAIVYEELNREKEAEEAYKNALEIFERTSGKKDQQYSITLNNLAELYVNYGDYAQAEKMYREAANITVSILGKQHPTYGMSIRELGSLFKKKGDYDIAIDYYLKALGIFEAAHADGKHSTVAGAYQGLASLFLLKKEYPKTIDYAYKSLASNSSTLNLDMIKEGELLNLLLEHQFFSNSQASHVLSHLVTAHRGLYEKSKDLKELELALSILKANNGWTQQLKNTLESNKDKLRILEETKHTAQDGMDLTLRLFLHSKDKKYLENAFYFSEINKSAVLSDAIKEEKALSFGGVPDSLVHLEQTYKERISELNKEMISAADSMKISLKNKYLEAVHAKEDLIKLLEEDYPKYFALKYKNEAVDVQAVQQNLLDEKTLLLEYFVRDTMIYLFAIAKNEVQLFPIKLGPKDLELEVESLRNVLTNFVLINQEKDKTYRLYTNQAHQFYTKYLKPALDYFKNKTKLVVITDGLMGHIPFEALLLSPAEPRAKPNYQKLDYLVRKYEVYYSYSTALLMENYSNRHKASSNPKLVAFAASYPDANMRLEKVPESRSFYHRELRKRMSDLPSAIAEVKILEGLFPDGSFFYGDKATETNFNKAALDADILHLAMHGNLNVNHPLLSNLAFTEDGSLEQDNYVEAHELSNMTLKANLVVLSACETGYGKFQHGEGVLSLARSFMYAGVPSLIVSLWQVNDNSTEVLMKFFYTNLSEGMTKSAALRQAKIDYISNGDAVISHPAFWAAFIQLGDNQAIEEQAFSIWFYVFGGLVLLILGILGRRFLVSS